MLTGQTSWTQAGRCGGQMCEMKTGKTETDGDKCDKCEGNGNLAGTCSLHTAGHTPTGWWDQLRWWLRIVFITVRRTSGKTWPWNRHKALQTKLKQLGLTMSREGSFNLNKHHEMVTFTAAMLLLKASQQIILQQGRRDYWTHYKRNLIIV